MKLAETFGILDPKNVANLHKISFHVFLRQRSRGWLPYVLVHCAPLIEPYTAKRNGIALLALPIVSIAPPFRAVFVCQSRAPEDCCEASSAQCITTTELL